MITAALTAPRWRWAWRSALAALLLAVTVLCLMPQPPRVSTGWDKSNHALTFAALAFIAVWAFWPRRAWWALAAGLLAYGGAIEIAQSFLPPRTAEWGDLLADGVGIAVGLAVARALCKTEMP